MNLEQCLDCIEEIHYSLVQNRIKLTNVNTVLRRIIFDNNDNEKIIDAFSHLMYALGETGRICQGLEYFKELIKK